AGARELRLVTGRKVVMVTPAGERELEGGLMTPQQLQQLVIPIMTPAARQAAATGRAEWTIHHNELGSIRAVIEAAAGSMSLTLFLNGATAAASGPPTDRLAPIVPPPGMVTDRMAAAVITTGTGTTAEMDSLLRQMFEMKASDLHMSVGS